MGFDGSSGRSGWSIRLLDSWLFGEGCFRRCYLFHSRPGSFGDVFSFHLDQKKDPGFNALLVSLGVLVGMLSRIFSDMISDPSSHGFLPFELMLGLVIVLPAAFLVSFLVWGIFQIGGENWGNPKAFRLNCTGHFSINLWISPGGSQINPFYFRAFPAFRNRQTNVLFVIRLKPIRRLFLLKKLKFS